VSRGTATTTRRPAPPPEVAPHPRFRERRSAEARRAGRARLRRINVVLALVCVAVWSLVVLRSSLLDVDHVRVRGAEATDPAAVRDASGIDRGDVLATADLDAARREVAALPWVDDVSVTRTWPGTVHVVVTERAAVAVVAHPDGWALLDARGRVLEVRSARPDDLVLLPGERTAAPGADLPAADRAAVGAVAALPDALRALTVEVLDGSDGIELVLADGDRVVVGDRAELVAKSESALAVRQQAERQPGLCRIDVRVPSAPVLTTGRGCA
jgi:cell division protein FtsQ